MKHIKLDDIQQQLETNGYAVIPQLLSHDELDALRAVRAN